MAVVPEDKTSKADPLNDREDTLEKALPDSLTEIWAPEALSAAQSQSLRAVFFNIWPFEQRAPSGRISPKKVMSPEIEAVPDIEALPTTSKLTLKEAPVAWRLNL